MSVVETYIMPNRKEVVAYLKKVPIKTGDIIYRLSSTKGPFGIPFSGLVAKLSKSRFSHASVIYFKDEVPYCLEVNDRGVVEYRLVDWLDFCVGGDFAVYRYKRHSPEFEQAIYFAIHNLLEEDNLYDFTFRDPGALYCTESVCWIYQEAGVKLCEPMLIREVMSPFLYSIFKPLNYLVMKLSGKGFDLTMPLYFAGNEKIGMLSSPEMECIVPKNPL